MVEQSRIGGHITGTINHTFIALIPKHSEVGSFTEYRPISLYNLVYKFISKIISLRIKLTMSTYITLEKYGFLQDKLIHDAVATT